MLKLTRADRHFLAEHLEKGNLFHGSSADRLTPCGAFRTYGLSYHPMTIPEIERKMKGGLLWWKKVN